MCKNSEKYARCFGNAEWSLAYKFCKLPVYGTRPPGGVIKATGDQSKKPFLHKQKRLF